MILQVWPRVRFPVNAFFPLKAFGQRLYNNGENTCFTRTSDRGTFTRFPIAHDEEAGTDSDITGKLPF